MLYIDEIHKYSNWSQEIKNISDSYPRLRVCYTGSSVLDFHKGSHDLSRRVLEYQMYGLSFREYLFLKHGIVVPKHSLEQVLSGKLKILLYIIAQSVPFKPNYTKIAKDLDTNRNVVADLFVWLEKAGMINILRDDTHGIKLIGKVNKIYLNNPNIAYTLSDTLPDIGNIRETIFFTLLRVNHQVTASSISDFKVGKYIFEVGGKNKSNEQIRGIDDAYIVKDDIEYGYKNTVPLWAFGMLY